MSVKYRDKQWNSKNKTLQINSFCFVTCGWCCIATKLQYIYCPNYTTLKLHTFYLKYDNSRLYGCHN